MDFKARGDYNPPENVEDFIQDLDFLIIGGGAAGYPAGVYAGRFGMNTVVVTKERGGLLTTTHIVENYPGVVAATGPEIMDAMEEHVKDYDLPIVDDIITNIEKDGKYYIAKDSSGREYKTKTVLLATGTEHRKLDIPGEEEFYGKGVSYCATCDAPLFKNKRVGVVGGSDSAAKEALLISQYAEKTYLIYRGEEIHPEPINMKRIEDKIDEGKIEIINNTNVTEIKGDNLMSHVIFDKEYNESNEFELDGLFIAIGHLPQNDLAKQLDVKLTDKGEIDINRKSETNVPGVYAAGDIVNDEFKQAIIGAAEGCMAAWAAYEYVNKEFLGEKEAKKKRIETK